MSNLENDPGSSNNNPSNNLNNNTFEKNPNTISEILLGIGISVFLYVHTIGVFNINNLISPVKALILFLIMGLYIFICVKSFRTNHRKAGILIIILTAPLILFIMMAGACAIMVGGI